MSLSRAWHGFAKESHKTADLVNRVEGLIGPLAARSGR
jgi:hypothetical protein